jgi:hypothetical protein
MQDFVQWQLYIWDFMFCCNKSKDIDYVILVVCVDILRRKTWRKERCCVRRPRFLSFFHVINVAACRKMILY